MARFLGTISPKTIDRVVASRIASVSDTAPATSPGSPSAVSPGRIRSPTNGSATYPVTSVVNVIATWAPESWNDSVRCAFCTALARRSPT